MNPQITYTPSEEKINVLTHALGFVLALIGLGLLIQKAVVLEGWRPILSAFVYGISLMVLYAASTLYHQSRNKKHRSVYQILDHASIFVLIAGTYTPFTLLSLNGVVGWSIFAFVWTFALGGIFLKFFFTGKYNLLSTVMYVLMGWSIAFSLEPLIDQISWEGFWWLLAGGIFYTIGAGLFLWERLPYNHAAFHVCVLMGSITQFVSVYFFVF
jgi:hemolysin III